MASDVKRSKKAGIKAMKARKKHEGGKEKKKKGVRISRDRVPKSTRGTRKKKVEAVKRKASGIRERAVTVTDSYQLWLSRQKPKGELTQAEPQRSASLLFLNSKEAWLRKQQTQRAVEQGRQEGGRKELSPVRSSFEEWISGQVMLRQSKGGGHIVEEQEKEVVSLEAVSGESAVVDEESAVVHKSEASDQASVI